CAWSDARRRRASSPFTVRPSSDSEGSLLPLVDLDRMLNLQTEDSALERRRNDHKETTLDIVKLRDAHLQWRARLERMLRGEEAIALAESLAPDQCELGRWLHGPVRRQYGHHSQFISVDKIHTHFHEVSRKVLQYYQTGYIARAEDALREVMNDSFELQLALAKLDMHLETSHLVNIVVLQADGRRFGLVVDSIS